MLRLFLFLLPCIAFAQYPKAMDFSKLYQSKIDSVAVIHRTGWTKETSWLGAPEEERITEKRKRLPLYKYTKESDCLEYCKIKQFIKKNILC